MSDEKDNSTPVRDGAGNILSINNQVLWTGNKNMNHMIGRVIEFKPGGVSLIDSNSKNPKQTAATIRVVFDVTIQMSPQMMFCQDLFRLVNPMSKLVLDKLLESEAKKLQ